MSAATNAEAAATLDARFPITGATDHIAYSTNGTSEWAGLARTPVGGTGWAAATVADPSVKANNIALTSAAATLAGTVTHTAIFSAVTGGTQRTEWVPMTVSRTVAINDQIRFAIGDAQVRLT